jgi:hypothetical protein
MLRRHAQFFVIPSVLFFNVAIYSRCTSFRRFLHPLFCVSNIASVSHWILAVVILSDNDSSQIRIELPFCVMFCTHFDVNTSLKSVRGSKAHAWGHRQKLARHEKCSYLKAP